MADSLSNRPSHLSKPNHRPHLINPQSSGIPFLFLQEIVLIELSACVLKIAYSWYSLPNSLFYSEFLVNLNVVHSLAFG